MRWLQTFEDLRMLKTAEEIADAVWKRVVQWDEFAKDVVGKQISQSLPIRLEQILLSRLDVSILERNFNFCIIHAEVCSKQNIG